MGGWVVCKGVEEEWAVGVAGMGVHAPLTTVPSIGCFGWPPQRFWFLETVARMPYFSYISMLHLYESLGWWRAGAELRKVHFAEEWNELHHLQVRNPAGCGCACLQHPMLCTTSR
jgi:ubiquinol oxidase